MSSSILTDSFDFLFLFVVAIYVVLAMYFLMIARIRRNRRKQEKNNKFLELLRVGLTNGMIENINDVYNIYKGLYKQEMESGDFRSEVNILLRFFLVNIIRDNEVKEIKRWKVKIDEFILENERTSPFSSLPTTERSILMDIMVYLKKEDSESVERKVRELSNSIEIRQEQLEKFAKQTKWSIPLAVIGLIFTIIFGITSLI